MDVEIQEINDKRILETSFSIIDTKETVLLIIYKLIIDFVYSQWISSYYSYWGMGSTFVASKYIIITLVYICVCCPFICRHIRHRKPSDYVILIWDFMYFIPGFSYLSFEKCSTKYIVFYCMFYVAIIGINELVPIKRMHISFDERISKLLIWILVSIVFVFWITYNGITIKIDLNDIYETRAKFRLADFPIIFRYLKNPMGNIIPMLIYIMIKKKKYIYCLILCVLQLGIFSMGAGKINFIFLMIAIGFTLVRVNSQIIARGFEGISFISLVCSIFSKRPLDNFVTDKLIRRMMITPNNLSWEYFRFFQSNDLLMFRSSLLKLVLDNPYDKPISYVIGDYIGTGANANNGLAGDAYANWGILSIVIFSFLYFFLFFLLNMFSCNADEGVVILASFIIAVVLIDSSFFTSLLTHGVILILLFLILYPYGMRKDNC